jgi:hypothetical protein
VAPKLTPLLSQPAPEPSPFGAGHFFGVPVAAIRMLVSLRKCERPLKTRADHLQLNL